MTTRLRLDQALVARGFYRTRARARDAILRGAVKVDGAAAAKPASGVSGTALIEIDDAAHGFVSRAALKLVHALDHFGLSPEGLDCLDIGASAGGFTQVLLARGAAHVTAIDVGHGQLHGSLIKDRRVTMIEGLNARDLTADVVVRPPNFIVADVSFISLKLALPPALGLAEPGAVLVALIKPQFEAGPAALDGKGIVRSAGILDEVRAGLAAFIAGAGWPVAGVIASPIPGGDGNREFLLAARKAALTKCLP